MKTLIETRPKAALASLLFAFATVVCSTAIPAQPAVEEWVRSYNGFAESDDRARQTVLDSSGNVIVVGFSDAGINGSDWLIIKYFSAGVPLWTNCYAWPDNSVDSANAVAADGSGNVIVTGYSYGSGDVTIKYSGAGVPLWTNRYNEPGNYWGGLFQRRGRERQRQRVRDGEFCDYCLFERRCAAVDESLSRCRSHRFGGGR